MAELLQTLHKQYRTEHYGPFHTREYYPWEYDAEAQQCLERGNKPSYFVTEEDCKFFQQQAKILQDRAAYIRQEWARQEATLQPSTKHVTQPVTQSTTQPATQQATLPEHSVEQEDEPQQANAENTAEKPSDNEATIIKNMALLSTVSHQSTQLEQEEEPIQLANAENTAEIPSDNKATIIKNTAQLSKIPRHMLSTVPRQIITQQAENTTATWPVIPTALIWYITAMTSQEEDLLRRLQPIGPLQEEHRTIHIWTN